MDDINEIIAAMLTVAPDPDALDRLADLIDHAPEPNADAVDAG